VFWDHKYVDFLQKRTKIYAGVQRTTTETVKTCYLTLTPLAAYGLWLAAACQRSSAQWQRDSTSPAALPVADLGNIRRAALIWQLALTRILQ
jgi:hypothetical protein